MVILSEGEAQYKTYPILNTIECTILADEKLKCRTIGADIKGKALDDDWFDDVFSVEGDISILSGGDKKIWVKPLPVGETCAIVARKRGERESPKGTDLTVICGARVFPFDKDIPEEYWNTFIQWKPLSEGLLKLQKGDIVGRASSRNRQLLDQRGDIIGRASPRNRQLLGELGESLIDLVSDIPYEIPEAEAHRKRMITVQLELVKEILSQFDLATRILILEAFWDVDVDEELRKEKVLYPNLPAGPWSQPDLWKKAKEKYPDQPMEAWRYYWEELKKTE